MTDKGEWRKLLPNVVRVIDAVVIILAMVFAQVGRFGVGSNAELEAIRFEPNYWVVTVVLGIAWWLALGSSGTRDIRTLSSGLEEYKTVIKSTVYFFGAIAIISYALQLETARGYVGLALPAGLILLPIGRWMISRWVMNYRKHGYFSRSVVIVGSPSAVEHLHKNFSSSPSAGYHATMAILPGFSFRSPTGDELALPVISVSSAAHEIIDTLDQHEIDVVALSAGSNLKPRQIRELGWELQERGISMVMAPALTDIAGPRLHTQPVAGLPLIHVSTPKLVGIQAVLKRGFDIAGALIAMLLLSPVFLVVSVAIKIGSNGPVFYKQERVGIQSECFQMYKFRSMVVNADSMRQNLLESSDGNGILFKMKDDPRVTGIGRFIRRYSIDELPQLWNVLIGQMSMVGPRPPLKSEVDEYERYTERRLLVKPGITGLWQVSGRSDLSWEESIRLDLYYVENWSLIQDLTILARTLKAVVSKNGAY
ncbi:sugar transferase [Glutamicibacter arilaitensis]|uniref:sugar transferase n=1 Tax=Glutamicibacter arilaitensis TaxID=256701 RepID=UPI003FD10DBE